MFRWKATEVLRAIDVPLLVLTGTKDIVTLPSASDFIANTAPRAQVLHVEGAGHMGFMEWSNVYNEAIARFADEVFGRVLASRGRAVPEAGRRYPARPVGSGSNCGWRTRGRAVGSRNVSTILRQSLFVFRLERLAGGLAD